MGTKTIGITDEVYDRLAARKRADESFTDLIDRLLTEARPNWRAGFGTLPSEDATELREITEDVRGDLAGGLTARQARALEAMAGEDESDEPP